jgi:hypothetical protein
MFCSEQFVDELAEPAGTGPLKKGMKRVLQPGDPTWFFFWCARCELAGGNYAVLMTKAADAFLGDMYILFNERKKVQNAKGYTVSSQKECRWEAKKKSSHSSLSVSD